MKEAQSYLQELELCFNELANDKVASGQSAYMKHLFDFKGITTPIRRETQKLFLAKTALPKHEDLHFIVTTLWTKPEREFQYFAQELYSKYTKNFTIKDIIILEHIITHKSWWDTIDVISPKLVSAYFAKFPDQRDSTIEKWLSSGNIWLQRSCILFQLKAKENTDADLLEEIILYLLGSKEFFINKAIGWILREYAKTNPTWVIDFVNQYGDKMANLSKKEALRRII